MSSYLSLFLSLVALALGHPVEENAPVSLGPRLSPRTDVGVVDEPGIKAVEGGHPRYIMEPWLCPDLGTVFCTAWCQANTLTWSCLYRDTDKRTHDSMQKPCEKEICIPEYAGGNLNRPAPGCGAKAACIAIKKLAEVQVESGSKRCTPGFSDGYHMQKKPRVATTMFDKTEWERGNVIPTSPSQLRLFDHWSNEIQHVGPADEQGGYFLSRPFYYNSFVVVCLELTSDDPSTIAWATLIPGDD